MLYFAISILAFSHGVSGNRMVRAKLAQRAAEAKVSRSGSPVYLPTGIENGVMLGKGFAIDMKGTGRSLFGSLPDCNGGTEACIQNSEFGKMFAYSRNVRSKKDHSALLNIAGSAEGTISGLKVGGSVELTQTSNFGETSQSFVIGEARVSHERAAHQIGQLELAPIILRYMQRPELFIRKVGDSFISAVQYGGSFMASYTYYATNSSDEKDLKVLASIEYEGAFSAKVDGAVDSSIKSSEANFQTHTSMYSLGGKGHLSDGLTPEGMKASYEDWKLKVVDSYVPLKYAVTCLTNIDSIGDKALDDYELWEVYFFGSEIGATAVAQVSREVGMLNRAKETAERYLNMESVKADIVSKRKIQDTLDDILSYRSVIETGLSTFHRKVQHDLQKKDFAFRKGEAYIRTMAVTAKSGGHSLFLERPRITPSSNSANQGEVAVSDDMDKCGGSDGVSKSVFSVKLLDNEMQLNRIEVVSLPSQLSNIDGAKVYIIGGGRPKYCGNFGAAKLATYPKVGEIDRKLSASIADLRRECGGTVLKEHDEIQIQRDGGIKICNIKVFGDAILKDEDVLEGWDGSLD